ncbi:PREDICTED: ankyrin-3-like isoform X16 [Poecilia mexicana]|uniref:ankyrin-3-like isoform X16 n=1 Tax=Poecilia mexicana TaxID=48701 RepID=UPI00072EEF70|nr:PREDICTED: ankyrin-3-like isoform X16 [Poecilia mexicana]
MNCFKAGRDDAMTGDTDKYLAPHDLRELGDDSLPQEGYMGFSVGARSQSTKASLRSFSSDRSNTLNRSSFTRDSMMIEEILAPTKDPMLCKERSFIVEHHNKHLLMTKDADNDSLRRYSWTADHLDNVNLVSSPVHSGFSSPLPQYDSRFLVSFMVDARGGSMRGSRHNGMRIIIPPRKCTAPTRITCRLVKRHKLASPPPMVEGEGLASRLVEVGPAGAQFLGPVIVEIPHFASMRGQERELILLRSENGESWKEHLYDCKTSDLNQLLNGMDEELDSPEELERKRICRIITKDFPQYFAVVSRVRQETHQMGPEGGTLNSRSVPLVQASFPEGALTKKIKVGLQAQPIPEDTVKKILGNRATFSPIVTVEPRRRKFHKPITMTIPVPPLSGEGLTNGYKGDSTPCLRLLCSITGGTSPAQWEDITGTTPLTFVNDCVSFTTNVSARFWLADCHQIPETVSLATQLYRELICVPYMAKFVVFAKMNDPVESSLRCFCMTDDKVDKTLEQQENFEEVARSKDIEVLEGRPIYVDCYGNLAPLTKAGQQLVLNFYAFKENRLPFCVKVRDPSQEPCGRLTFLKECRSTKGLPQTAVCNLNITLPAVKKESESDAEDETEKPDRRHTFASLALRKRYSYLTEPAQSPQSPCERTDVRMAIVADHLGLSWTELARELNFSVEEINFIRVENPNSLTAQSFMLLKKWVHRDGKNATTDALTAVLTKINRLDIVTLLEGPIFDYGNITGTRCFADDNAVFPDQSDGDHSIDVELKTPTELNYVPCTPLRSDEFFSEGEASVMSPSRTTLTRPSDLSLAQTTSTSSSDPSTVVPAAGSEPPIAGPEDTVLTGGDRGTTVEMPENDRRAGNLKEDGSQNGREEEEEMTQERLRSLLEDIQLEGGVEEEEMTEERVNAILEQVRQAEKNISSVPGWRTEASGATAGHSSSKDTESSPDSPADSLEQPPAQNGGHTEPAREGREKEAKKKGAEEDSRTSGPSRGREDVGDKSQHKVQETIRADESGSDDDTTVTTRVYRRRVILKGEEARNIPGQSVTEEQFIDDDGNLVTRKVTIFLPCCGLPANIFHSVIFPTLLFLTCFCPLQVIRKVVRRGFNSQERLECEGQAIPGEGTSGVDEGEADDAAAAAASAEAAASTVGNKGGRGKKRGKRSRHGHKEEAQREKTQPGDGSSKKHEKKSQS